MFFETHVWDMQSGGMNRPQDGRLIVLSCWGWGGGWGEAGTYTWTRWMIGRKRKPPAIGCWCCGRKPLFRLC